MRIIASEGVHYLFERLKHAKFAYQNTKEYSMTTDDPAAKHIVAYIETHLIRCCKLAAILVKYTHDSAAKRRDSGESMSAENELSLDGVISDRYVHKICIRLRDSLEILYCAMELDQEPVGGQCIAPDGWSKDTLGKVFNCKWL